MGLLSLIPCPQVGPKVVDTFFTIISVSSGALGTILIVISSQLTGIAFIMVAIFSGVSLFSIKRMRLRASVQKSVNVLKQENDELKERLKALEKQIVEGSLQSDK